MCAIVFRQIKLRSCPKISFFFLIMVPVKLKVEVSMPLEEQVDVSVPLYLQVDVSPTLDLQVDVSVPTEL